LFGVLLVVLSYREVVSVYTRAGGSYVVARENFGPRVAQVAAVALLIDYVVTVAVQTAAGSAVIVSAFPFLASFVAEDSFLPRWLGRRGHRLVFSNGIILLAALSVALMLAAGATVDALIPFYAIGVFTGFAMAGFGMARYHRRIQEPGWRRKLVINLTGGIYTALVVLLFAVVKFTEGAWLIVIIFPVLVFILIRLNREYQAAATCLADAGQGGPRAQPPNHSRRVVLLLVDGYDPATIAALKYARGLRPTVLRAVHFSLDSARADQLCQKWVEAGTGIPLELADCPDRRLAHAAARLATSLAAAPGMHVTVVLPRRCYPPLAGRLLRDHTADRIARVVSRVPDAAATIVPFDVTHRVGAAQAKRSVLATALKPGRLEDYEWPAPPPETIRLGRCASPARPRSRGVCAAEIRSGQTAGTSVLACQVTDSTGELTAAALLCCWRCRPSWRRSVLPPFATATCPDALRANRATFRDLRP
jgi:hypothetical protein